MNSERKAHSVQVRMIKVEQYAADKNKIIVFLYKNKKKRIVAKLGLVRFLLKKILSHLLRA
jgi:hypothetical protein